MGPHLDGHAGHLGGQLGGVALLLGLHQQRGVVEHAEHVRGGDHHLAPAPRLASAGRA